MTIFFNRASPALTLSVMLAGLIIAIPAAATQGLSAGKWHTCAIDDGGGVQCWGANSSGQLGDGSLDDHAAPARVLHLDSGVIAIAATASDYSCAVRSNGEVLCWGSNEAGKLGDGTTLDRQIPTQVVGFGPGSGVKSVTLGGRHTCALKSNGAVYCWGNNEFGQLGTGTTEASPVPTQVFGLGPESGVVAIAAGLNHSCAVKSDQSVSCWGSNASGALGDGTLGGHYVPLPVTNLGTDSGAVNVSAGSNYSCATRQDGAVLCWGDNSYGQLGDGGSSPFAPTPQLAMVPGSNALDVSGIQFHTCARTDSGVYCWGLNAAGQLGDGTVESRSTPAQVLTLGADINAIAVGGFHSCARKSDGALLCWGANFRGQLGDGNVSNDSTNTPKVVALEDYPIFSDGFEE